MRGFSLGKFSFLDALDAQRTLFDSQRQLLEQLSASHKARAEIDRLLGSPTVDLAVTGI
ncbi:Cobalt-zinc-cadmium resistance protein CzcC precursor [compost metagenome]